MRTQRLRYLIVIALLLIISTVFVLDYVVGRYVRDRRIDAARESLYTAGKLIAASLVHQPGTVSHRDSLQPWCVLPDVRLQLVDANGIILADCYETAGSIGTKAEQDEVRQALNLKAASASRQYADELYAYVAVPIQTEEPARHVLWMSQRVTGGFEAIRVEVAGIVLAASALALWGAYLISRRLSRRIEQLKGYADGLLESKDTGIGNVAPEDEFGALETTLHTLGAQMHEFSARWKLESSRSEAILSSMAEGVLAVDPELRVVFCNRAVTQAMGVRPPIRERTPVIEFMRDTELVDVLKHVVSSGESVKQNLKLSWADGRAFEVQAAPFATAVGKGALAIFYDTTDLERLEQVRKDFVANVSHEMRTPLASIVGYSDTLLDGGLEDLDHNRKFIEVIRANAIRLNSIASDLLVLSELESGNSPGEPECVSVRDVLESAINAVEAEARNRHVQILRGHLDDARVLGHRFRFEQAIMNLLVNAVKFNREGGEVRVEVRRNAEDQVRIAVSDTGVGIPSQDLPRVFERFYRVDKARSRQVGGTGLGLSIVRHVVERMHGKIEVDSQVGRGSTFTIIVPVC